MKNANQGAVFGKLATVGIFHRIQAATNSSRTNFTVSILGFLTRNRNGFEYFNEPVCNQGSLVHM